MRHEKFLSDLQIMDGFAVRGTEVGSSRDDIEKWITEVKNNL